MKINNIVLKIFIAVTVLLFSVPVFAQEIDFGTPQEFMISSRGFYPFSPEANQIFKEVVQQNAKVGLTFSNFKGLMTVAPAADGKEIGPRKLIWRNNSVVLNYQRAGGNINTFGISIIPLFTNPSFILEVQPFAAIKTVVCTDACAENLNQWCVRGKDPKGNDILGKCKQTYGSACACGIP